MFKKCKIIFYPTNDRTNIIRVTYSTGSNLIYSINKTYNQGNQHIYIVSNDEQIKVGDWVIVNGNQPRRVIGINEESRLIFDGLSNLTILSIGCSKVIATTNSNLGLPRLSNSFIKKYCELNGIAEVMVEYEELVDETQNDWFGNAPIIQKLKVAPDNTITIKKVKDNWNKKEVKELIQKYCSGNGINWKWMPKTFDNWIEENLGCKKIFKT